MNTETIHDVKKGVEFGRLLQLPDEVVFSSDHMADLLITEGSIRPFNQMRSVRASLAAREQALCFLIASLVAREQVLCSLIAGLTSPAVHTHL